MPVTSCPECNQSFFALEDWQRHNLRTHMPAQPHDVPSEGPVAWLRDAMSDAPLRVMTDEDVPPVGPA